LKLYVTPYSVSRPYPQNPKTPNIWINLNLFKI